MPHSWVVHSCTGTRATPLGRTCSYRGHVPCHGVCVVAQGHVRCHQGVQAHAKDMRHAIGVFTLAQGQVLPHRGARGGTGTRATPSGCAWSYGGHVPYRRLCMVVQGTRVMPSGVHGYAWTGATPLRCSHSHRDTCCTVGVCVVVQGHVPRCRVCVVIQGRWMYMLIWGTRAMPSGVRGHRGTRATPLGCSHSRRDRCCAVGVCVVVRGHVPRCRA